MTRALPALLLAAGLAAGLPAQEKKDPPKKARTGPAFEETPYGELPVTDKKGKKTLAKISLYTLTNRNGVTVKTTNYGAIVTEIHVPDKDGKFADVALGFDTFADYR